MIVRVPMEVYVFEVPLLLLVVAACLGIFGLWLTWPIKGPTRLERWLDRHPKVVERYLKAASSLREGKRRLETVMEDLGIH